MATGAWKRETCSGSSCAPPTLQELSSVWHAALETYSWQLGELGMEPPLLMQLVLRVLLGLKVPSQGL